MMLRMWELGGLRRRSVLLGVLCAAGCYTLDPPAPPADLTRPVPVVREQPRAPEVKEPTPPPLAEVEVMGRVKRPRGARGELHVYITATECFAAGATSLSEQTPPRELFADEVFVPQGTRLWICAALLDDRAKRSGQARVYGVARGAPFLGQGEGEVMFTDLEIPLARGAPVPLPQRPASAPVP